MEQSAAAAATAVVAAMEAADKAAAAAVAAEEAAKQETADEEASTEDSEVGVDLAACAATNMTCHKEAAAAVRARMPHRRLGRSGLLVSRLFKRVDDPKDFDQALASARGHPDRTNAPPAWIGTHPSLSAPCAPRAAGSPSGPTGRHQEAPAGGRAPRICRARKQRHRAAI